LEYWRINSNTVRVTRSIVVTLINVFCAVSSLSACSPFAGETLDETIQNINCIRWNTSELFDDVTQEAVVFVQQCLKKSPRYVVRGLLLLSTDVHRLLLFLSSRNRLTIPACIEHKWLSLASSATNRRENAIFLTEKLRRFAHEFRQRCREQTEIQRETIIDISKR
jgi:hypothetical protein